MAGPRRTSGSRPARGAPERTARPLADIRYPAELPVVERRAEIAALVAAHQVVIVAGETGSGKTTQLPKICLELGRGVTAMIGHTQPRRIAARAVAERLAEELAVPLGGPVGYAVRFSDQVGPDTLVKVMTDGILLAELQRDRSLRRYDTIIVDEAHERSLNIDFLLGYIKSLLPRRPDLKVIITSATIDTERFSRHFDDAPIIEVSGRTYPVELRYRPLEADEERDAEERDQITAITDAVDELRAEGPGDVLVFLSGEREIRDTADALRRRELPDTEVVPLYARLSTAEQHRVFRPHSGRRIVLATNVAETSLTVPGIRYVIDPGFARISRYNRRTKVQRLPIEAVSQASANQRSGRCGRIGPGVCIRLYSEEDFRARAEFTDPEILRTNLAAVILQMAAIGLGDVASFPFIDPPEARNIRDGMDLLEELGAIETDHSPTRLTGTGRQLARLPVDPRLGRMVLESVKAGCLREVIVIAAALSIQDPRERPTDKQAAADEAHARFRQPGSDFLGYLELWSYLQQVQEELSSGQFRRLCRREFLNFQRVREWQDVASQIRQVARELGFRVNREPADPAVVHKALLSGLLSHVGLWDSLRRDYLGSRNSHWAIAPGSSQQGRSTRWVMAGELVETNRMWGRTVAGIRPEWAEELGAHLVKASYGEPYWDERRAAAMCDQHVTLYGLPLADRRVNYSRIEPEAARDFFIQQALVEERWDRGHSFMDHNREVLEEAHRLEERSRRRDLVVGDEVLFDFFDERLGPEVVSGDSFARWWRRESPGDPHRLDLSLELVLRSAQESLDAGSFPDQWEQGELHLALTYEFDPLSEWDGVTVHIPVTLLDRVSASGFDWQIPGFRLELVMALLRSLPKAVRRQFVPVADHARAFLRDLGPTDGSLATVLAAWLSRAAGSAVSPREWNVAALPSHLRMTFVVEGSSGEVLGASKDLEDLKGALSRRARREVASVLASHERRGLPDFPEAGVETEVQAHWNGQVVTGFPALSDNGSGTSVDLLVFSNPQSAHLAMWSGTRRLLLMEAPGVTRALRSLTNRTKLAISNSSYPSVAELLADATRAAADRLMTELGAPVWTKPEFDEMAGRFRSSLAPRVLRAVAEVGEVLAASAGVRARLDAVRAPALLRAVEDMRAQLDVLTGAGFVGEAGLDRLADIDRYLAAMGLRLEKAAANPARDAVWMDRVHRVEDEWTLVLEARPALARTELSRRIRWMLEDLRVSIFAQTLGGAKGVSEERIRRAIAELSAA